MSNHVFVSVGSRFPMDRLLVALDHFAAQHPTFKVSAQSGKCRQLLPHTSSRSWFNPTEFEEAVIDCDIFVSHAGMGNILLAAQHGKPIVIMPRQSQYKEHINDHQLATAEGLKDRPFIYVVNTAEELQNAVLTIASSARPRSGIRIDEKPYNEPPQRAKLVDTLRDFLDKD
jgi:UDP-N-acetylglucosamine transferase subunit ALG13